MSDQKTNCENILNLLRVAFPNSYINVYPWRFFGTDNLMVAFAVDPKEKWTNGIMENDPAHCKFCIEQEGNKFVIGQPTLHFTNRFHEVGVKFRKLTADTEEQAVAKLAKWFIKNRDAINSLSKGA